ncbi:hypothetical protein DFH94DRAFT_841666, partial [Russula ochroleuca]
MSSSTFARWSVSAHLGGRRAVVVFAEAHEAERSIRARGREVIVFQKHTHRGAIAILITLRLGRVMKAVLYVSNFHRHDAGGSVGGNDVVWEPRETGHALSPGSSGYSLGFRNRLTRRRLAQLSRSSGGRCPDRRVLTNHRGCSGSVGILQISRAARGSGVELLCLYMTRSQVRREALQDAAVGCTTLAPLRETSSRRRFCALYILYRPCVPRCVHLYVARVQSTCAVARDTPNIGCDSGEKGAEMLVMTRVRDGPSGPGAERGMQHGNVQAGLSGGLALSAQPRAATYRHLQRSYHSRTTTHPSLLSLQTIMFAGPSTSTDTSQSSFVSIFNAALETYKRKTKNDLASHPLLPSLQSCDSPEATLTVLREQIPTFGQSQNGDDGFTKWVTPTVNVLYAFSSTLGQGVGLAFPPANAIFAGIGVLLMAAKDANSSKDKLVDLFNRIERFFGRLEIYTGITPTAAMRAIIVDIMVEVLTILAIATKEVKRGG